MPVPRLNTHRRPQSENKSIVNPLNQIHCRMVSHSHFVHRAAGEAYELGFGDPIAISAETGLGMAELYEALRPLLEDHMLQVLHGGALPPPGHKVALPQDIVMLWGAVRHSWKDQAAQPKIKCFTQVKARPPTFVAFMGGKAQLSNTDLRFLTKSLKEDFDLGGIPIRIMQRSIPKKVGGIGNTKSTSSAGKNR
uniref:GTPase Der C-terminal KH-domain-like domain-containing protein n=1 Tax=Vitis vinifera TaxID=29760 RepID=A5CBU6_VITVI|nr:hypothetical protein VITISV_039232 [Vitis vinifera]